MRQVLGLAGALILTNLGAPGWSVGRNGSDWHVGWSRRHRVAEKMARKVATGKKVKGVVGGW